MSIVQTRLIAIKFLLAEFPRLGNYKGTFRSLSEPTHQSITHGGRFILSIFNAEVKEGSCEYQFLKSLVYPDGQSNPI